MQVSLNETFELIQEELRIDITKDNESILNKFTTKPQGIILQDSYNNPFFPITPLPRIDTSKLDLSEIYKRYRETYSQADSLYLPWHFCVELVDDRYYVFNTRPIDTKFPLKNKDVRKDLVDDNSKSFFSSNIFDISEAIHVCVIGDSNLDVYTNKLYTLIGRNCMIPILNQNKLPNALYQRVFPINIGKRFNLNMITKFIMR